MHHEFSFYSTQASSVLVLSEQDTISIIDEALWHRLKHVIRAQPHTQLILFDTHAVIRVTLLSFETKYRLTFKFEQSIAQKVVSPSITLMLPLLKKDALADAFYSATELGAQHIQLITTEKSQHAWDANHDKKRYEKVMIAAAEQSKQFILPTVANPVPLREALTKNTAQTLHIHADPQGLPLFTVMTKIQSSPCSDLIISIGPEGDLTCQERALLAHYNVTLCALTPTVLRATQALVVLLGALRSVSTIPAKASSSV